jgi:hypothetical protein
VVLSEARKVTAHYRKRWILPLSSAALILLGIGLSLPLVDWKQDNYQPKQLAPAPAKQTDTRAESEQSMSKPALPQFNISIPPKMEYRAQEKTDSVGPERKRRQQAPAEVMLQSADSGRSDMTPEQWLREIETMIEAGREQAAKRALDGFIKIYPDYPLPKSLQTWQANE